MLMKCVLFFLTISLTEGFGILRISDDSSVHEKIIKTILDSCYENDSLSSAIIISGDFNKIIDERSIIQMNSSLDVNVTIELRQLLNTRASKIILIGDSLQGLTSDIKLLEKTRWWHPMIPLLIVDKSHKSCSLREVISTLMMTWEMDLINSIYICVKLMNPLTLYTLNMMAKYAPHPWKLRIAMRISDPYYRGFLFSQPFDRKISCRNLNYDKTRLLNEHVVRGASLVARDPWEMNIDDVLYMSILERTGMKTTYEFVQYEQILYGRLNQGKSDLVLMSSTLTGASGEWLWSLSPHAKGTLLGVVKLKPEVTTLEKIGKMWSIPVLILATIAVMILFLVLIIESS